MFTNLGNSKVDADANQVAALAGKWCTMFQVFFNNDVSSLQVFRNGGSQVNNLDTKLLVLPLTS